MPLRAHGAMRKRWRYIGVYGREVMLCAAVAQVGPLSQSFWAVWADGSTALAEGSSRRPGSRTVRMDGPDLAIHSRQVRARLHLGESEPIESICPSGEGWGWTRKRAGIPVDGHVEVEGRRHEVSGACGVDDESAGYHQRHLEWHWSAGVGRDTAGRPLAWNLVTGINDPPERSERAVWIDGVPHEPAPVVFDDLDAVRFAGGGELGFSPVAERSHADNFVLVRSDYAHRFGTFEGDLDGVVMETGFGVMERHEAVW